MAVAKEFLFSSDSRLTADFGKAINHAARVEIIAALLNTQVLSYQEIIEMIPLKRSTINDHLKALKRYRLIEIDAQVSGDAGYRLNKTEYNNYRHAIKQCFAMEGKLRRLADTQGEAG